MSSKVQMLFEALPPEGSIDELGIIIDRIRDVYDLEHVSYLAVSLGRNFELNSRDGEGKLALDAGFWRRRAATLVASTYTPDWGSRYEESNYMRIDPVVEDGMSSFMPMNWKELRWDTKSRKRLFNEAVDAGVGNQGYTVPIRGPNGQYALFTINKHCSDESWAQLLGEARTDFLVIAHFIHDRVIQVERVFQDTSPPKLSDRERDVLRQISLGKNRAQVAYELNISENTIRVYLDSARHKLGALNIPHAVAIGIQRGIINV